MARWTQEGWESLETIAFNAYQFTGFRASALNVMRDAKRVCDLIQGHPGIGKSIKNIYNEDRYWHPFSEGKVLVWKSQDQEIIFVAAYYALPEELHV